MKLVVVKAVCLVLLIALVEIVTGQTVSTCDNTFCPRGRRCLEAPGGSGTICDCPSSCSPVYEPVCSVYGITFDNRCELHKFACQRMTINIAVEKPGQCDPVNDLGIQKCDTGKLLQFPNRYLDWLLIAKKRQGLNPKFRPVLTVRGNELNENEVKEILEWEFKIIDSNNNGKLDGDEMREVELELLSIDESCIRGFLKSCDLNNNGAVSLGEWFRCFPKGHDNLVPQ